MNAGPQSIVSLLTSANQRLAIPVYQRAYSWDEEQCRQLWDDIVAVGRRSSGTHFTGSVVMVLGGEFSASGVNKLLIIDGQQRITTLSLLIAAMAEFARDYPEKLTRVSYEEIIDSGYLILKYKKGEDHYRLTLSQGDERTLRSVFLVTLARDAPPKYQKGRISASFYFGDPPGIRTPDHRIKSAVLYRLS